MSLEKISPERLAITHVFDGEEVVTGGPDGQMYVATFVDPYLAGKFVDFVRRRYFFINAERRAPIQRVAATSGTFIVELLDFDQLTAEEQLDAPNNGCGKRAANYIRVSHNGVTLSLQSDAIAPQDKFYSRDLIWIVAALEQAYTLGRRDRGTT